MAGSSLKIKQNKVFQSGPISFDTHRFESLRFRCLKGLTFSRLPRKEVIQPQVLLRLPCYDFTPITNHTVGAYLLYK